MGQLADVIVVGGGILGTSVAFNLVKRGVKVTLVEKRFIAAGPTGRSSGNVRQHYSNAVTARMALRSLRIWQNFEEVVGGQADLKQTGYLLTAGPQAVADLKANIALQQSVGINTRFVSPEELRALEPHLRTDDIGGAAYEPESGYADASAAAAAFAAAARRQGATLLQDTEVLTIQTTSGRATGVITDKGPLAADTIVVAAGPWTPRLFKTVGIDLPITACRVQVCFFRWPPNWRGHRVCNDLIGQIYLRPEGGRQMLVGSIDPKEAEARVDDPDHFNEQVDAETVALFAEQVAHRYPDMLHGSLLGGYASLYDVTPDWNPILDQVAIQGLYCCAGGSGHCFKMGPVVGEMMAERIINGKHPDDDLNLFSYERFDKGELVRGRYEYNIMG